MSNDWKKRLGVLYSTDPNYKYDYEDTDEVMTLPPAEQQLYLTISRKHRAGKEVSLVSGFVGSDEDLQALAKMLKQRCGVGGSAKAGEIIIQGDQRAKILQTLQTMGYKKTKLAGG